MLPNPDDLLRLIRRQAAQVQLLLCPAVVDLHDARAAHHRSNGVFVFKDHSSSPPPLSPTSPPSPTFHSLPDRLPLPPPAPWPPYARGSVRASIAMLPASLCAYSTCSISMSCAMSRKGLSVQTILDRKST